MLLVRLTELINVKRLGTDLLLTTPAKGILAVGSPFYSSAPLADQATAILH